MESGGVDEAMSAEGEHTTAGDPAERRNAVVVGMDGSHNAREALRWAAAEAVRLACSLEVCTFWTLPYVGYPAMLNLGDYADTATTILHDAMDEARQLQPSLSVSGWTVEDPPALGLVKRSRGARLLVVGSRGLGGFRSLLLGSVSRYCVEHAHCPVLVVRAADQGEVTAPEHVTARDHRD